MQKEVFFPLILQLPSAFRGWTGENLVYLRALKVPESLGHAIKIA